MRFLKTTTLFVALSACSSAATVTTVFTCNNTQMNPVTGEVTPLNCFEPIESAAITTNGQSISAYVIHWLQFAVAGDQYTVDPDLEDYLLNGISVEMDSHLSAQGSFVIT